MRAKIPYFYHLVRGSFWFLPAVMVVFAIVVANLAVLADRYDVGNLHERLDFVYTVDLAGARLILTTIAGSMATMASLVFSLTLVTLTLTAQQLGPRLIDHLMRDQMVQMMLGLFISTFVLALLVTGRAGEAGEDGFVPVISVLLTTIAALASLAMLVVYIHRIATAIQADTIIARLAAGLQHRIDSLKSADGASAGPDPDIGSRDGGFVAEISDSGYVQMLDKPGLLSLATREQLRIVMCCTPGSFLVHGAPLARLQGLKPVTADVVKALRAHITIGPKRTATDDIEFEIRNLAEIGVRALSPGINDFYTAFCCIDYLADIMARLMTRRLPDSILCDADGEPRVILEPIGLDQIYHAAFHDLWIAGRSNPSIVSHLARALAGLAQLEASEGHGKALHSLARMMSAGVAHHLADPADQARVRKELGRLDAAFGHADAGC